MDIELEACDLKSAWTEALKIKKENRVLGQLRLKGGK
jgi:hypothetical protein